MTLLYTGWDTANATGTWTRNPYFLYAARAEVETTGAPSPYQLVYSGSPLLEIPVGGSVPELISRVSVERPYSFPEGGPASFDFRIESDVAGLFQWEYVANWTIATDYSYPTDAQFARSGVLNFTWLGQTVTTNAALATWNYPEARFTGEVRWLPDDDVVRLLFTRPVDQDGTSETVTLEIASPSGTPAAGTYAGWEILIRNSGPQLAIGQELAALAQPTFVTAEPAPPATSFMVRGVSVLVCGDEEC